MFEVLKEIKEPADHWVKKVTKVTKALMVRRVMLAKRANEDLKVFKALPA